jgi:hypothetical protein
MADLSQELIDAIENIVEEKFNELIAANKLDVTAEATSINEFAEQMMIRYDGNENITQGFFRVFLDWLSKYYTYNLTLDEKTALAACRYLTPVDLAGANDVGKIIAPFAFLVIEGEGILPTIPDPVGTLPDDAGFNQATHLMEGGMAYNKTDDIWYYRANNTIHELQDSMSFAVADIVGLSTALGLLEPKQAGKSLTKNELTDILKSAYDGAASHAALVDIHLEPDTTTIQKSAGKLAVVASAIKAMITGTLPLAVDINGNITLAIDDATLEIVDNKLKVKAVAVTTKLSFNEGTGELSIDAGGDTTVDLSSLSVPGGTIDLSNYVQKTGAANQEIQGNLDVTGEVQAFS